MNSKGMRRLVEAGKSLLILLLALRKPIEKAEGTEAEKSGEEVGA